MTPSADKRSSEASRGCSTELPIEGLRLWIGDLSGDLGADMLTKIGIFVELELDGVRSCLVTCAWIGDVSSGQFPMLKGGFTKLLMLVSTRMLLLNCGA